MTAIVTAATMAARFDEHQRAAYEAILGEAKAALFGPRDPSAPPQGKVLALMAAGGAGKTEVALAVVRGLIEHAEQAKARREAAHAQAQAAAHAQAEAAVRQAQERARANPQTPPRARPPQPSWDDPFEDVKWAPEDATPPPQWRRPESATERKAREKAEREAAEMQALRDITVSFADDE